MMENENLLPKNIRQIGEVRGRQRICLEDYVMTYIRKTEERAAGNFLGVFLGERKTAKNMEYIFARGILEVPDPNRVKAEASVPVNKTAEEEEDVSGEPAVSAQSGTNSDKKEKWMQDKKLKDSQDNTGKSSEHTRRPEISEHAGRKEPEENEQPVEHSEAIESCVRSCAKPGDPWARLKREQEMYFPGCQILGCCVIGRYPAGRLEALFENYPEAKHFLYHLQDQEERLYWLEGEKYEGVQGYLVFYEQNRRMQEYLEESFGEKRVESEGAGDSAIIRFREKVKSKAEEKSRSFLKLASSFFVVGVLLAGVVAVNRVEDIRKDTSDLSGGFAGQDAGDAEGSTAAADSNAAAGDTGTTAAAVNSEYTLAGADEFWSETTEEGESADADVPESDTGISDTTAEASAVGASISEASSTVASQESVEGAAASEENKTDAAVSQESATGTTSSEESASYTAVSDTEEVAVSSTRQTQATYVIREGDTLAGICAKYYGSLDFLEELCAANGIADADLILPGQRIILP